jgi:hypothetical protein
MLMPIFSALAVNTHPRKLAENSWTQIGGNIDGEAAGDNSGWSIAMSSNGNRVAIGATSNRGDNGIFSGHVRVFDITGSTPTQIGGDIDGEAAGDQSGWSLAISSEGKSE